MAEDIVVRLVLIVEEDEIGHIVEDHGSYAKVTYTKNNVKHTVILPEEDYIEVDEITIRVTEEEY